MGQEIDKCSHMTREGSAEAIFKVKAVNNQNLFDTK